MRWMSRLSWLRSCSVSSSVITSVRARASHRKILTHAEGNSMLKINFSETPAEERWILHGRLTNPWVQELRASWKKNHRADVRRACIVGLDEVNHVEARLN